MTQQKPFVIAVLCILGAWLLLSCQQEYKSDADRDKDEENGLVVTQELSNSRVQAIEEDASGQLWIATFRGLNRYDGHEYHQYFCTGDSMGLPDNNVQSLLCDKRGRLWVATVNGVCRYTRQDNFERIPMQTGNKNARKLLMDSRGRIFAYNGTELLMYDETHNIFLTKVTRKMTNQSWGDCFIDGSGGILIISPRNVQLYSSDDFKLKKEVKDIDDNGVFFFELLANDLLLASGNGSLSIYDVKAHQFIPIPDEMKARLTAHGSVIQAARLLDNNTILLSTSSNGHRETGIALA